MTLDPDTISALGYGDAWEQLALRFGPWSLRQSTRRDWRKGRTGASTPPVAPSLALTTAQRKEASRRARLGHASAAIADGLGVSPNTVRAYLRARRAA